MASDGGITIQVNLGFPGAEDAFERLIQASKRLKPVFADFGEHLLREVEERFQTQTDPEGNPWADLAPETWRRKKNNKILTETTRLRGSFNYEASDEELEVGSPVVYSAIHQFGGTVQVPPHEREIFLKIDPKTGRPGNRFVKRSRADFAQTVQVPGYEIEMPARPMLGITEEDADYFVERLADHLQAAWQSQ